MPNYDYKCVCGNTQEMFRSINKRHNRVRCEKCDRDMALQISSTQTAQIKEHIDERMNRHWQERKERKASGEW